MRRARTRALRRKMTARSTLMSSWGSSSFLAQMTRSSMRETSKTLPKSMMTLHRSRKKGYCKRSAWGKLPRKSKRGTATVSGMRRVRD